MAAQADILVIGIGNSTFCIQNRVPGVRGFHQVAVLCLTLRQRFRGPPPLSNVMIEGQHARPARVNDVIVHDVGVETAAVFSHHRHVLVYVHPSFSFGQGCFRAGWQILRRVKVGDRHGQQLMLRITQHSADGRVRPHNVQRLAVQQQQAVDHPVINGLKLVVALPQRGGSRLDVCFQFVTGLPQRLFSALPLGDVDVDAENPGDLAVLPDRGDDVVGEAFFAFDGEFHFAFDLLPGEGASIVLQP